MKQGDDLEEMKTRGCMAGSSTRHLLYTGKKLNFPLCLLSDVEEADRRLQEEEDLRDWVVRNDNKLKYFSRVLNFEIFLVHAALPSETRGFWWPLGRGCSTTGEGMANLC
jgi:hypothetical protein